MVKLVRNCINTSTVQYHYMSHVMRKPAFCIYENKGADQLRGKHSADHHLCFRYIDSRIHLLPKLEISSLKPTAQFVLDQVGNLKDMLSHYTPHMSCIMRKPDFCICENKDTDQLRGHDQRLCSRYTVSTIPLLSKSEISSL